VVPSARAFELQGLPRSKRYATAAEKWIRAALVGDRSDDLSGRTTQAGSLSGVTALGLFRPVKLIGGYFTGTLGPCADALVSRA